MKSIGLHFILVKTLRSLMFQILLIAGLIILLHNPLLAQSHSILNVPKTDDFTVTGFGTDENWSQAEWLNLTQRTNLNNDRNRATYVKVLYSDSGIYFLFKCEDDKISSTFDSHFQELWREDVVEVFLWPNEGEEVYFEYQLSPLNYELPILVSKAAAKESHWIPFEYSYQEGDLRKTIHKTSAKGGKLKSGAVINEWIAEFFIPFELLNPLKNRIPEEGTTWRANIYRVDYDYNISTWTWQPVNESFHELYNYGTLLFE